ncbi:uncharacterized protein Z518_07911 [Rhinocladiella mackenziei CBS 650.93]|uniref:Beta-lactamase-related domain-containing protein n=1 Tax=Rhinocladiella mackenziei CBS 650.93 TaxID=1442369 RepID=A0A0D2FJ29_9EURO|nr:uncharacterized protein Z518_07911 [Rhinocladiella mackenziei CBS 650.93]KIX01972.1 hypothetical protein Z518_07911 [Rhinocladiella mackenziei CBS 650.93]
MGSKASSQPRFRLSSETIIKQIALVLNAANQDRIAIHFEDLSLESQDQQVQVLNLFSRTSEPDAQERHESDPSSSISLSEIIPEPENEQVRVRIEDSKASGFIYAVGSFGKDFITLTWIMLLKDNTFCQKHNVTSDTRACVLYNEKSREEGLQEIWLRDNPSIHELLIHVNGFAPMNEYLIAPDGTSLSSQEEFLKVAAEITHDKYEDQTEYRCEYSNANYIFLGIILELITGKPLWLLVKEVVIDKLGLEETTFHENTLRGLAGERVLVEGARISSDGTRSAVDHFNHLDNIAQYASMGLRSSLRDLAKFNREILLALDGQSQLGLDEADLEMFFKGRPMAPYGYFTELGRDMYSESPNRHLYPDGYPHYHLGKPKTKDKAMRVAFRKAGYIDGFGCNVTLMPKRRISLIVLGNSTGPIDTTLHISNFILQEALHLSNPVNIVQKAIEEGHVCRQTLRQIESPEGLSQISPQPAVDLTGTYKHQRYEQQITVHGDGMVTFHTGAKYSSKMNLVHIGDSMVMVLPGAKGLGFDTWSAWREMRFQVLGFQNRPALIQPGARYAYIKA